MATDGAARPLQDIERNGGGRSARQQAIRLRVVILAAGPRAHFDYRIRRARAGFAGDALAVAGTPRRSASAQYHAGSASGWTGGGLWNAPSFSGCSGRTGEACSSKHVANSTARPFDATVFCPAFACNPCPSSDNSGFGACAPAAQTRAATSAKKAATSSAGAARSQDHST